MAPFRYNCCAATLVMVAICCAPSPGLGQGWSWPQETENLKVLPDTISAESLSRIMRGFTSALGVRCEHCHVGQAGMPLSEFDFPADDRRAKRVARKMLEMVRMINRDVIATIEEPSGTQVDCFTCHRGQTIPPEALHRLVLDTLGAKGPEGALHRYDELRREFYGAGVYDFSSRTLIRVTDRLLDEDRPDDAILFLNRGVEEHPDNAMIRYYTGRAYLAKGDTTLARLHFEQAVGMEPDSRFFRRMLDSIGR